MDHRQLGLDDSLIEAVKAVTEKDMHPNQEKLDKNKNGKLDKDDFKILRGEKVKEETELDEDSDIKEGARGTFHTGSKSYFKAGQTAIKNMKAAAKEREAKEAAEKDKETETKKVDEETELDEAIKIEHDRYMRSHGKKAGGTTGNWMFTNKHSGDVDYNNEKEVHQTRGSFKDASKSAKEWAKKHGHSSVYVMEEVELDEEQLDELSKKTLVSYVKKAADSARSKSGESGFKLATGEGDSGDSDYRKAYYRTKGIKRAAEKLAKEEVELTQEQIAEIEALATKYGIDKE